MQKTELTLREAKGGLRVKFDQGVATPCPCCGQTVKKYPRALTSTMARQLIQIYHENKPVNYKAMRERGSSGDADYSKLRHWGLVEQAKVGWWQITQRGRLFVEGILYVPRKVHVYDNRIVGESVDVISVHDALGEKFDYDELMRKETLYA